MFKVSLLPDSYRRRLQSRDKIDIVSKIALVILLCLFVVYGGFAVKDAILKSKLQKLERQNQKLENEFPALLEYQARNNNLIATKQIVANIKPKTIESIDFISLLVNEKPDYVKIDEIDLSDWFNSANCTLACTVQDYQDMVDFKEFLLSGEMGKYVKQVAIENIQRQGNSIENKAVKFNIILSVSGVINHDGSSQGGTVTPAEEQTVPIENTTQEPVTDNRETTTAQTETTTVAATQQETTTAAQQETTTAVQTTAEGEG